MDKFEEIAEDIFRSHGLSFDTAERATGWTNAVWINNGCVLRLSKTRGSDRIRREAERSKALPALVGYPKVIATGITDDGYEWCLSERAPGQVLSSVWDGLDWVKKAKAIKQIIMIMDGVHSVDVSKVERLTLRVAWYNTFDKARSFADIERYITDKIFTRGQGLILRDILENFYECKDAAAPVLCHGDITPDNLLWHEGDVVSLLDFEHAVIAPRLLDIHSLVNMALVPYDEAASKDVILFTETKPEIKNYVAEMIALFKPYLSTQSDKDLFVGYNVLFRQRFLESWLENHTNQNDIEQCDAYQKLLSFCDGRAGYLSYLF